MANNTIIQWNCRSLYQKRFVLSHIKSVNKPFAICLQETFSLSNIELAEIQNLFNDYFIYFKTRNRVGRANPRGGVAILIHMSVPHRLIQLNTPLEAIAASIKYRGKEISVCSLYLANS